MTSETLAPTRPPLSLIAVAVVLGWVVAGYAFYAGSSERQATEAKLAQAEAARAGLATELEQQRAAVAQADELRQKLAAVQADLAQSQARLAAAEQRATGLTADLGSRTHERDALQARLEATKTAPAEAHPAAPKAPARKTP